MSSPQDDLRGAAAQGLPPADELGAEATALAERLFPIPRSLTGDGVRETLRVVGEEVPLEVTEVPSGTEVLDWIVPPEWKLREAWIEDAAGRRIVDLADHPLHVLGYSEAVDKRLSGAELQGHLYSIPEQPDLIPARTSYWERRWGFSLQDRVRREIRDEDVYHVRIDATHDDGGSLTYAEAVVPGTSKDEILLSTYTCHPGLANDGVSGIVVATLLVKYLRAGVLRHTVRLLLAPATIGAIAWLASNEERLGRVRGGVVASCLGDRGPLIAKLSRRESSTIDRAASLVVSRENGSTRPFQPWGTDERQFCSPGFDLPVIALTRTPHGEFPEHHTSADNLSLLDSTSLAGSIAALASIIDIVDRDRQLVNLAPKGEPRLGDRGLYPTLSAGVPGGAEAFTQAILWVLNLSDGTHSLLEIADRSAIPFWLLVEAADILEEHRLLAEPDTEAHA